MKHPPTTDLRSATLISSDKGTKDIKIKFPFNHDDINAVRELPGRRYIPEGKYWTVPVSIHAVNELYKLGFSLDPDLESMRSKNQIQSNSIKPVIISGLKKEPYPFQKQGISFIYAKKGRVLLADEMGLGKTLQALGYLHLYPKKRPAVILCPASLKLNWEREILTTIHATKVQILEGTKPYKLTGDIIILNYDILPKWVLSLREKGIQVIIADECHKFKNNSAKRTKAVKALAKGIPHFIALSGTPIINRPIEIFNAVQIINPHLFSNQMAFARRYCNAKYNGFGWDFNGSSNTQELNRILTGTIMLRRLKKDVLQDLPDKVRAFIPIELSNQNEYNQAETDFIQWVRVQHGAAKAEKASNAQALTEIESLKQLAVRGKMEYVKKWIADFLETDEKLVIFAIHKFVIDELMIEFGKIAVVIDGSVNQGDRKLAVARFQKSEKIKLFVGNIQAAGIGLTLTAASNVVILELPWTPGDLEQAIDRCHRIGQKNNVTAHFLLASGTIEEKIAKLLDDKRKIMDSVLDGKDTESASLLSELINSY